MCVIAYFHPRPVVHVTVNHNNTTPVSSVPIVQNLVYGHSVEGSLPTVSIGDPTDFVNLRPATGIGNTSSFRQVVNLPPTPKAHLQLLLKTVDGLGELNFIPATGQTILRGATWLNAATNDLFDLVFLPSKEWIIQKR